MKLIYAVICCFLSPSLFASNMAVKTAHCDSGNYSYHLFAPAPTTVSPAILLLHGAGDEAGNFIQAWKGLAKKENIVLIAPQLDRNPKFEDVAIKAFRCMGDAGKFAKLIHDVFTYLVIPRAGI